MVLRADYKVCRPPAQLIPNLKGLSHEKPGWLIQHFHLSKAGHWTWCKSSRDLTVIPFSRDVWVLLWVLPSVTLREDILPKHQFTLNISKQNQDLTQQELWSEISEVSISQGRGAVTSVHTSMFIGFLSLTQMETLDFPLTCMSAWFNFHLISFINKFRDPLKRNKIKRKTFVTLSCA